MVTLQDINELFDRAAPKELSEVWDNDGVMVCENSAKEVKRVLCALEVREKTALYAAEHGFDLIVTHHPLIFKPLSRLNGSEYRIFDTLIKGKISVLSYHTRFDSANGGVNDCLAERLELCDVKPMGIHKEAIGRIGFVPPDDGFTAIEFGNHIKTCLGCENIMVSVTDNKKRIKTVGLVAGAGKDYIADALCAGVDAFITSEIPHHMFASCMQNGLTVFDCGHYYTENPAVEKLCDIIKQGFPEIFVENFDVGCPYFCI